MPKRFPLTLVLIAALVLAAAVYYQSTRPSIHVLHGKTMGTTYNIKYVADNAIPSEDVIGKQVHRALQDVDDRMSTYKPDSELMRFNRHPVEQPFTASADLAALIRESQQISRMSGGAYDVTVGPLVNLWGFGAGNKATAASLDPEKDDPAFIQWLAESGASRVPPADKIQEAMRTVGYDSVAVDDNQQTLTRLKPVFVDLSSIAKGYGVDQAARALEAQGITDYMVEVGGEIRIRGHKPDGQAWRIAIRQPELLTEQADGIIEADNKGIATSGDYLNYYEQDGVHYSHLIDARTGYPEKHRLASVAVVSDNAATADAYATMFMILGEDKGLALAEKEGLAAYFIYHTGKGFESVASTAFRPYLVQ
ncbi:FAD:protein FMN transferase [Kistimonas asteriae]|uniref:FAD:protein FMN transferase n=1 Tax=Kistimonas asteriae TaxID=517724 RepID=UPI001BA7B4C2|nr:FAD:protein FMN transferase [Kistimonas asteriae]